MVYWKSKTFSGRLPFRDQMEDFLLNPGPSQKSIYTRKLWILAEEFGFQGSKLALGDPQILTGSPPFP
jgi:hypothetical protein